jgi:hypothetical protein
MQPGKNLPLALLAGALLVAGWSSRSALAATPLTAKDLTAVDIGGPGAAGSTVDDNGKIVQKGSGADIWGTEDQFQFAYQKLSGNGSIQADVVAQDRGGGSATGAKSGVMIRATTDPESAFVNLSLQSGEARAVLWEYRPRKGENATGGHSDPTGYLSPRSFPTTLRLERRGDYIYGWGTKDGGKTFQQIGYPVTVDGLGAEALFGLATDAGGDGEINTSTFANVSISADLLPDPINIQLMPRDKSVVVTWDSTAGDDVTFNIYARLAPAPTAGPAIGNDWGKVNDQPVKGRSYVVDGLTNGTAYDIAVAAVVGGNEGARQTAGEDHTGKIGPVTPNPTLAIGGIEGWAVENIGTRDPGRASVDANGVITMEAGGRDAWDQSDGISYLAIPIDGDFTATARIVSGPTEGAGTDGWTNGALMARETLNPSSRFASAQISTDQQLQFRRRLVAGRTPENVTLPTDVTGPGSQPRPIWFQLSRKGDTFTALYSLDNTADASQVKWLPMKNEDGSDVGPENVTIVGFSKSAWIGIDLNGRGEGTGTYSKMVVDNVSVKKG